MAFPTQHLGMRNVGAIWDECTDPRGLSQLLTAVSDGDVMLLCDVAELNPDSWRKSRAWLRLRSSGFHSGTLSCHSARSHTYIYVFVYHIICS